MITTETTCYTEIVTLDTYKLRSLRFQPDVIFDIGANVGVFTTYARILFPDARIVAIEPHYANFRQLCDNVPPSNVVFLNQALGLGSMWRYPDIRNTDDLQTTTAETYISSGSGYQLPDIQGHPLVESPIRGVMLDSLFAEFTRPDQRVIVKIDCEGAENVLFCHPPSIEALCGADFVTMELHPYWATREVGQWADGQEQETDIALANRVKNLMGDTHRCESDPPMFYAWRK